MALLRYLKRGGEVKKPAGLTLHDTRGAQAFDFVSLNGALICSRAPIVPARWVAQVAKQTPCFNEHGVRQKAVCAPHFDLVSIKSKCSSPQILGLRLRCTLVVVCSRCDNEANRVL